MIGGALGGIEALALPAEGVGFWPLISMGAVLGGTMRSPLTSVIFAVELTHDINVMLPLLLAAMIAHGFTVLALRRSILTEKVARRGYHLSREYAIDPLEIIFAREVVRTGVAALPSDVTPDRVAAEVRSSLTSRRGQRLFPVVGPNQALLGVITRSEIRRWLEPSADRRALGEVMQKPVVVYEDEPLRVVVFRMAETGLTRMPVVTRQGTFVGMLALTDLLTARTRILESEQRRERVLGARFRLPAMFGRRAA
jgi:CBS domain-containing protein